MNRREEVELLGLWEAVLVAEPSTYLAAVENKWLPSFQVPQAENRKFTFISHYFFLSYLMGALGVTINTVLLNIMEGQKMFIPLKVCQVQDRGSLERDRPCRTKAHLAGPREG